MLKSFAGGRLFGGAWGQGRPRVLALHGWARTHADFDGVFAARPGVAPSAVGPDLPGFGATPPPPEPWGTEWYAEQLLALFEERPGSPTGSSSSATPSVGGSALRLQQLVPERIERLVLTGVPLLDRKGRRTRPASPTGSAAGSTAPGLIGDERMEALRKRYGSPGLPGRSGSHARRARAGARRAATTTSCRPSPARSIWCGARTTTRCPSRWRSGRSGSCRTRRSRSSRDRSPHADRGSRGSSPGARRGRRPRRHCPPAVPHPRRWQEAAAPGHRDRSGRGQPARPGRLMRFDEGLAWLTVGACVACVRPGRSALVAGGPARALPGRVR